MTTRTKLNLSSFVASAMIFLNVFSHPLGIPEGFQWVLIFGVVVPLGLTFRYIKKLKEEKVPGDMAGNRTSIDARGSRRAVNRRLVMVWLIAVGVGLGTPFWLPITGVSRGFRSDFIVGVVTAVVVSIIFGIRLWKISNQGPRPTPSAVTPAAGQPPRQP